MKTITPFVISLLFLKQTSVMSQYTSKAFYNATQQAFSIAVDSSGSFIYAIGQWCPNPSNCDGAIFISKSSTNGTLLWNVVPRFAPVSAVSVIVYKIKVDSVSGDIFCVGSGPGFYDNITISTTGTNTGFLMKYSSNGTRAFTTVLSSDGGDYLQDLLIQRSSKRLVVSGYCGYKNCIIQANMTNGTFYKYLTGSGFSGEILPYGDTRALAEGDTPDEIYIGGKYWSEAVGLPSSVNGDWFVSKIIISNNSRIWATALSTNTIDLLNSLVYEPVSKRVVAVGSSNAAELLNLNAANGSTVARVSWEIDSIVMSSTLHGATTILFHAPSQLYFVGGYGSSSGYVFTYSSNGVGFTSLSYYSAKNIRQLITSPSLDAIYALDTGGSVWALVATNISIPVVVTALATTTTNILSTTPPTTPGTLTLQMAISNWPLTSTSQIRVASTRLPAVVPELSDSMAWFVGILTSIALLGTFIIVVLVYCICTAKRANKEPQKSLSQANLFTNPIASVGAVDSSDNLSAPRPYSAGSRRTTNIPDEPTVIGMAVRNVDRKSSVAPTVKSQSAMSPSQDEASRRPTLNSFSAARMPHVNLTASFSSGRSPSFGGDNTVIAIAKSSKVSNAPATPLTAARMRAISGSPIGRLSTYPKSHEGEITSKPYFKSSDVTIVALANVPMVTRKTGNFAPNDASGNKTVVGIVTRAGFMSPVADLNKTSTSILGNTTYNDLTTVFQPEKHVLSIPGYLNFSGLSNYSMDKRIAKGGGGEVYIGTAKCDNLKVYGSQIVVKLVNPGKIQDMSNEDTAAFFQEVSILHLFTHEQHFVKLLGYSEEPVAMLLKYYPKGSLAGYLTRRDTSKSKRIQLSFIKDISVGLLVMHMAGFAHCDIKPQNVLIDTDERGRSFCVLTDFGVTSLIDKSKLLVRAFQVSSLGGFSLSYAPPELIIFLRYEEQPLVENMQPGDIYSFGIVTSEVLTRKSPWT